MSCCILCRCCATKKACNIQSDENCGQNIPLDETQPLNNQSATDVLSTSQQYTAPFVTVQPSAPAEDQSLNFIHHEIAPPSYEAACAKDSVS